MVEALLQGLLIMDVQVGFSGHGPVGAAAIANTMVPYPHFSEESSMYLKHARN